MEKSSPRFHHHHHQQQQNNNYQSLLPSPNSTSSSSSSNSSSSPTSANGLLHRQSTAAAQQPPTPPSLPSPRPIARSESANPYPTTFVQADTSSFKQVVQMLTGSPKSAAAAASPQPDPTHHHNHHPMKSHSHAIPPIKSIPKKNQSSGFKLYERRNSLKNLKINPLNPFLSPAGSGFSPRKPEILSPSILDFPSLVLSPVTPLIHDPFDRSGSGLATCYAGSPMNNGGGGNHQPASKLGGNNNSSMMVDSAAAEEEEQAIKEKGFYLHASPATTPREAEPPRLLPLFPVTSPRVSGSD
ncbi:VQ motif-containing protein 4 [Linum grandiflorum]